jgi:hypothetical protein
VAEPPLVGSTHGVINAEWATLINTTLPTFDASQQHLCPVRSVLRAMRSRPDLDQKRALSLFQSAVKGRP